MVWSDLDPTNPNSFAGKTVATFAGNYGLQPLTVGPLAAKNITTQAMAADQSSNAKNAAGYDTTAQDQSRGDQRGLTQMLQAQAAGYGPSVAQSQFAQNSAQAAQNGQSMFNNVRGAGGAMNAYYASLGAGQQAQQAANQAQQLRATEMNQGRQMLGQNLDTTRGQDLNAGQMQQQNQQFNVGQFNKFLLDKQQQQAQLQQDSNNAIYGGERDRLKANEDLRNKTVEKTEDAGFGMLKGGGAALAGGA